MNIKVLGSGCPTCKKLHQLVVAAVKDLGLEVEVEYITDISEIIKLGVMSSPVLTINNHPVSVGTVPSQEEITKLIQAAQST